MYSFFSGTLPLRYNAITTPAKKASIPRPCWGLSTKRRVSDEHIAAPVSIHAIYMYNCLIRKRFDSLVTRKNNR